MFRLHWQQAASATSISEGGTDYLRKVLTNALCRSTDAGDIPHGALLFGCIAAPGCFGCRGRACGRDDRRECQCKEVSHGANHGCRIEVLDCNRILPKGSESEERLVHPGTCRMPYGSISAIADVGAGRLLRQQCGGLLTVAASSSRMAASCISELTLPTLNGPSELPKAVVSTCLASLASGPSSAQPPVHHSYPSMESEVERKRPYHFAMMVECATD